MDDLCAQAAELGSLLQTAISHADTLVSKRCTPMICIPDLQRTSGNEITTLERHVPLLHATLKMMCVVPEDSTPAEGILQRLDLLDAIEWAKGHHEMIKDALREHRLAVLERQAGFA